MPESVAYPDPAWNATEREFPGAALVDLLREAALTHADRPAVITPDGQQLSHDQLAGRVNQLARLLAQRGVGRGDFVAVYCERTPWAIAALLAAVTAGAAYVPIDVSWPTARILDVLSQLNVTAVVAGPKQLKRVQEFRWRIPSLVHVICPDLTEPEMEISPGTRADVREFFDFLVDTEDPVQAAGFNFRPRPVPYTRADVQRYAEHVATLAEQAAGLGADILEIGVGSGEICARLAPSAGRYVAVDPGPQCVRNSVALAAAAGVTVEGHAIFADEVATTVEGPFDLIVLASTVQFFPDLEYFLQILASLGALLRPGGAVLLADLINPAVESHAGVAVPPELIDRLPELISGVRSATAMVRKTALHGELASRYDALIRYDGGPAERDPLHGRLWTGTDVGAESAEPLDAGRLPEDVAYAIFTSGSTGSPKGVLVADRSVVNLIDWLGRTFGISEQDRVLFVTSFCFDLSVWDVFGVLAAGGSIRIATEAELAEPEVLLDILEAEPITIWDSAPAALAMLTPFLPLREVSAGRQQLRLVLLSGDWVPLRLPDDLRAAFPNARVCALGGATECTVWSNYFEVGEVDPSWPSIPYGRPIQNCHYYVLDAELAECPIEVPGDLYIGGTAVAIGYVGAPELTASKFLPHPDRPDERIYRTGDRAMWLPDGTIRFLGRLDDQVKLRGYRIELGDVHSALARCPGVSSATVAVAGSGDGRYLVGFYVPAAGSADETALQARLAELLPQYMIPAKLVAVAALPLTPTGKVDKKQLLSDWL